MCACVHVCLILENGTPNLLSASQGRHYEQMQMLTEAVSMAEKSLAGKIVWPKADQINLVITIFRTYADKVALTFFTRGHSDAVVDRA